MDHGLDAFPLIITSQRNAHMAVRPVVGYGRLVCHGDRFAYHLDLLAFSRDDFRAVQSGDNLKLEVGASPGQPSGAAVARRI